MLEGTLIQKVLIAIFCGFLAAMGVKFFDVMVVDANNSVNSGYENRSRVP